MTLLVSPLHVLVIQRDSSTVACENSNAPLPNVSSGNCSVYSSMDIFICLVELHIMYARTGIQGKAQGAPMKISRTLSLNVSTLYSALQMTAL